MWKVFMKELQKKGNFNVDISYHDYMFNMRALTTF